MKLSKFANLVKAGGRCAVLHVAGSGIWLSTGTAIYRATELPDMEGREQVRTVLDMTADAWKKVYLTEDWPESVSNVLGLNLAPYAQGEQDTEKLKVAAAPNGLWCSACRCKVDGELIFYNEAYLAPLAEEIKKSEYIYYTARQTQTGQRYLVVHDGMDVLAAIMPMNILKEEYITTLRNFRRSAWSSSTRIRSAGRQLSRRPRTTRRTRGRSAWRAWKMENERAIEILDPEHREPYESLEPINEACRMGVEALRRRVPESPYPDGDAGVMACPSCGSGEYLHNEDGNRCRFCGQCGQAIDWDGSTGEETE